MPPEPRYLSPALPRVIGPDLPPYQDSAGGLTPTPVREYSPAQQLLLKSPTPKGIDGKRAKVPGEAK